MVVFHEKKRYNETISFIFTKKRERGNVMGLYSFKGGIHPDYHKQETASKPLEVMKPPEQVVIPMLQHIRVDCQPLVAKGDSVKMGQKIGESDAFLSAPVHSSVSGQVIAVEPRPHQNGSRVMSVVIQNDFQDLPAQRICEKDSVAQMSAEEIRHVVREAGIVGMGGAGFPVHIKLDIPKGKACDTVIVNGAECEPYLSSDHHSMLQYSDELVYGLRAVMKAVGAQKGIIAIEDNKRDAEQLLCGKTKDMAEIEVALLETKYPQGSEKHIIKTVLGKEVPSGALPIDVGVVVNNVDTCISICRAIRDGMPPVKRCITVSGGCVREPKVLEARIGTPFETLVEAAGGMIEEPLKIIVGGPMMGQCQVDLSASMVKTSSGLLLLSERETGIFEEGPCLRCGKCVDACPMNLMPMLLSVAGRKKKVEQSIKLHAVDCLECGCCTYSCPSHRYLLEGIRMAKQHAAART